MYTKHSTNKVQLREAVEKASSTAEFQETEPKKMLLDKEANRYVKDRRYQVPIQLAVHLNKTDVVEVLLNEGIYSTECFKSLVFKATTNGNKKIVKMIIENGLKQNLSINYNNSLNFALKRGFKEIVEYVIHHCEFNNQSDKVIPEDIVFNNDQQFIDCVDILFKHGFTISLHCLDDNNFIFTAVENGFANIVTELLRMGLDPNLLELDTGLPLLHIACLNKQHLITKILIEFGADVNFKFTRWPEKPTYEEMIRFGKTPLDWAVRKLDVELIKLLLANGASVDDSRVFVDILREKIENRYKVREIIEILVEHIADGTSTLCNGMNYVQYFAEYGFQVNILDYATINKIITMLTKKGANLNIHDPSGCRCTPLFIAIKANNFEMVKVLLENGADIFKINSYGDTPLHSAAAINDPKYIKLLLDYHADVNAATQIGLRPLHIAAYRGHVEVIKILLDHHADVEVKNYFGFTPLHSAVQSENSTSVVEIVQHLLKHNAKVNVLNCSGFSPLHIAVQNRYAKVVKILIYNNADVNTADNNGCVPLHYAVQHRSVKIVKILLNNYANVNSVNLCGHTPLHLAAMTRNVKISRILLESGANVYARNLQAQTALHFSTEKGDYKISQLLLEYGAEVNAKDIIEQTPFHYASMIQCIDTIKILLENKADTLLTDKNGRTPLFFISAGRRKCIPSILHLLLEFNIDFDIYQKDKSGKSPMQIAQAEKNISTVNAFLEIEKLKIVNVGKNNITFYGLMKKSIFNLSGYSYNENIIETLKSEVCDEMFPLTIDLVRSRFAEGIARNKLIETFHDYSMESDLSKLFYGCVDNMVNYLSTEDIKNFIEAVRPSRNPRTKNY